MVLLPALLTCIGNSSKQATPMLTRPPLVHDRSGQCRGSAEPCRPFLQGIPSPGAAIRPGKVSQGGHPLAG